MYTDRTRLSAAGSAVGSLCHALGFELDGIDLSPYTNRDAVDGEVALFMKRKLG